MKKPAAVILAMFTSALLVFTMGFYFGRNFRGAPITVAVPDATHLLADRTSTDAFRRRGGVFVVRRPLRIAAVCANPWSARGRHVDGAELLASLHAAIDLPVINVKEGIRYDA